MLRRVDIVIYFYVFAHIIRVDVAKMERGCGKYTSELCFQGVFTTFFTILVVASSVLRFHMR